MLYRISASFLNSWAYMWDADEKYQEQAYSDFVDYIKRIRKPPNIYMQKGIDFEELAINGGVPIISQEIEGGAFQVYAERVIEVDGTRYKLVGFMDVVKAGIIYDIKRNTKYEYGKFQNSFQHPMYFVLTPEAYEFRYLIGAGYSEAPYDTTVSIHQEVYYNDGTALETIKNGIRQLVNWLKARNLYELYKENYKVEE